MLPQIDNEVIIIGAGISGLSTALKLHEKAPTLDFQIIESDYEIGGRLKSQIIDIDTNLQLDIHCISPLQTELIDLINKLKLNLIKKKHDKNQFVIFDYNERITKIEKQHICNICQEFNRPSLRNFLRKINKLSFERKIDPTLLELTMSEFIRKNLKNVNDRAVINYLIWRFCGVSPTQITLEFYLFLCRSCIGIEYQITFDETVFYLEEGVQEICKRIANNLNKNQIILNQTVKKIEQHSNFVKITTNKSTYCCYFVILAIPPSSLQWIQFTPTVQKLDVCANLIRGKLQQFVAVYKTPFWTDSKYSGEVYSFNSFPIIHCFDATTNPKYPILSGYFIQDYNSIDTKNNMKSSILSQLSLYFGEQALKPIKFDELSWSAGSPIDCFSTVDDIRTLQERTDRIIWAGSETSLEWYGQISGGILAGYRAAIEALYELRPACISIEDLALALQLQRQYKKKNGSDLNKIFPKSNKIYLYILLTAGLLFMILKWRRFF